MARDLHKRPFDENTKFKLALFSNYLSSWLPVFLAAKIIVTNRVNIFDFFAGPGMDVKNTDGSPLVIIRQLKIFSKYIRLNKIQVNIYLNEYDKSKYETLTELMKGYESDIYNVNIFRKDFNEAFNELEKKMSDSANLLFFDQSGIKYITEDIFKRVISHKLTDFLFFISSSTINRFFDEECVSKYLDTYQIIRKTSDYYGIHRGVLNYYKSLIPPGMQYYLAPFSIKKGSNIYGLIFGSGHPLGIYKFLEICWRSDSLRGEANFDIDRENINPSMPSFFPELNKPEKLRIFEHELEEKLLDMSLKSDLEIVLYCLTNGFLPKHAKPILIKLKERNKLIYDKLILSQNTLRRKHIPNQIRLV